jgi:hypothetical protein
MTVTRNFLISLDNPASGHSLLQGHLGQYAIDAALLEELIRSCGEGAASAAASMMHALAFFVQVGKPMPRSGRLR